jgi:hypothetical protein
MTEYPIWGIPENQTEETLLYVSTSKDDAAKVVKYLETVKNCTKCRVQTLRLDNPYDVVKSFANAVNI